MSDKWRDLAAEKAREMGASEPEEKAEYILKYIDISKLTDSVCLAMDCGVPPPSGHKKCVDYNAHAERFESAIDALEAWEAGNVTDWLDFEFPCDVVMKEVERVFLETIETHWHILDDHDLYESMVYIQDHIAKVPPRIQEKWKWEFVTLFGGEKDFKDFTEKEASWLRGKVAAFVRTTKKVRQDTTRRPRKRKRTRQKASGPSSSKK